MLIAVARSHEEHRHPNRRVVAMPTALRNNDEIPCAENSTDFTAALANGQLAFTREDVKKFVACRMQFPWWTSDKASDPAVVVATCARDAACNQMQLGQF